MSIKTGTSSNSNSTDSTSSALSPLSADGSIPVVDSPGGDAVAGSDSVGGRGVGAGIPIGLPDGPGGGAAGLEKDLEALDLKAGSDGHLNGNGVDVGKGGNDEEEEEDDRSIDDPDTEERLRRYARDLITYHRTLFDGVKTRDHRKRT